MFRDPFLIEKYKMDQHGNIVKSILSVGRYVIALFSDSGCQQTQHRLR
jgi:hypothetical protein